MLILVIMKKLITATITGIIFGVIIFGSGSISYIEPRYIANAQDERGVYYSADINASFLAPMSLNIQINPDFENQKYMSLIASFRDCITLKTS